MWIISQTSPLHYKCSCWSRGSKSSNTCSTDRTLRVPVGWQTLILRSSPICTFELRIKAGFTTSSTVPLVIATKPTLFAVATVPKGEKTNCVLQNLRNNLGLHPGEHFYMLPKYPWKTGIKAIATINILLTFFFPVQFPFFFLLWHPKVKMFRTRAAGKC